MKAGLRIVVALALSITAVLVFALHRDRGSRTANVQEYADPATCVGCHRDEASGYAETGMARAFSTPNAQNTASLAMHMKPFFHAASNTYYLFVEHEGRWLERRWQQGFDGNPDNVEELSIDYVMGSGNHVRTYLHREQDGTLIELPLAWYAEEGGHWGMNPGFDSTHPMTRRAVAYECMFCHNAYPSIPPIEHRDLSANPVYGAVLPAGIDCQRCHGPGATHVQLAQTKGIPVAEVRKAIVNPARLSNERQMEVCEQCHLETTSRQLPDRIRNYDRDPFGYRPGTPLAAFNAYYERDSQSGRTDNFEIVNAAYRLRQSQCFLKSQGALTCESCHDPHDLHKGGDSAEYYAKVCLGCHRAALTLRIAAHLHPGSDACISCHMPRRRAEDVVHAVMTDHLIQRQPPPPGELLAQRQEIPDTPPDSYRGPVKRYLLDRQASSPDDMLYDSLAQVIDSSNLEAGVPALKAQLQQHPSSRAGPYIELGDAMRHTGDINGAIDAYREALARDPLSSRGQRRLGAALGEAGRGGEGLSVLDTALHHEAGNALLWYEKALIERKTGDLRDATADFLKALDAKPDFAEAQNDLGSSLAQGGNLPDAEAAFRRALAIDPSSSGARANLGRVLAGLGKWQEAAFQLQRAGQLDGTNASAHSDAAVALLQVNRLPEAEREARAGIAADTTSAHSHDVLGRVLAARNASAEAEVEFESALKSDPNYPPAQLDLAMMLLDLGRKQRAMPLLYKAAGSGMPAISNQAQSLIRQLEAR